MKSPGAVYKKLKEAKFRHLIALYRLYLKKIPENCKYNLKYAMAETERSGKISIRLCTLHQDSLDLVLGVQPHLLEICQSSEKCQNCNAFILKYTREDVKEIFLKELNTPKIKEKKYPDICALEWVLERSEGIPPFSWIQKLYYLIKENPLTLIKG